MLLRFIIISLVLYFCIIVVYATVGSKSNNIIWADSLISFSSEYISSNKSAYKAKQILGRPSVLPGNYHETVCAWAPFKPDRGIEFIKVGFSKQLMKPRQIIINQNLNSGAIISVELFDKKGKVLFSKKDNRGFQVEKDHQPLIFRFPQTETYASCLSLILNTKLVKGYNMIDAIGLSENKKSYEIRINSLANPHKKTAKELLSKHVNSKAKELLPLITPDGRTLYFTRWNHPENMNYVNGVSSQDIWMSQMNQNGEFKEAVRLEEPLNNKFDNSICSITPDGQKALLLNIYNSDGTMKKGLSIAQKRGDNWLLPVKLNIQDYYNNHKFGEYCLSASGRVLIMAIERDDTYGSKDCYISFYNDDGFWTKPRNLGPVVNTAASEVSPFLAADEKTLYYSTAGLPGYGREDIFVTRRLDDDWLVWSEPQNLGQNINSAYFDAYYSIPASGEYAYFSSVNGDNLEDIFRIELPAEAKPQPIVLVKGYVYSSKTKKPIAATIIYESLTTGEKIGEAHSNAIDGSYTIALPKGQNYGFRAKAKGFVAVSENIDLSNLKHYKEYFKDLYLVPMEIGTTVRLNNVFFKYNNADITDEATSGLNRLVALMMEYPNMKIEISGHTDNKGTEEYNLKLSKKRAKAVYNYLLTKSINVDRLSYKGYGERYPIADNSTEKGRSKNRRVVFKIINL